MLAVILLTACGGKAGVAEDTLGDARGEMAGAGAETYRALGGCPATLEGTAGAILVAGGSAVPAGSPGSVILLERGQSFSFTALSGRSYGAYTGRSGTANPSVGEIFLDRSQANIRFDGLDATEIDGRPGGEVTFSNGRLGGEALSVNAIAGGPLRILCNEIGAYGLGSNSGSCTLWQPGSTGELVGNHIGGCGDGTAEGKHGIYAKADGVRIAWNTFGVIHGGAQHNGQAISIRFQGMLVEHNLTTDPQVSSVGYFSQDTTCVQGNCGPKNVIAYNDFISDVFVNPYGGDWYTWNDFEFIGNTGHGGVVNCGGAFICGAPYGSGPVWTIADNDAPGYAHVYAMKWGVCPRLTVADNVPNESLGDCP